MRDFLTGLAIVLIVVLTTVLVAPYFVDWTSQRGFLEARLSHALGQKVTIGGHIDLKLLPTPYLILDQVVVGGDDGAVKIGVHHLDLELTVAPLLHGEFDIVEARLEEPTIRVTLGRDRAFPALPAAPAFQADIRFDRIKISDGTVAIADPLSGHTFVLDHLDLDAEAGSFTGPFKVSGAEGPDDQRTKFRLATASAEKGRAHAHLIVDETASHAGLELDGIIDIASGDDDGARQNFDGRVVVSSHLSQAAEDPAWTLSGPFKADSRQATMDDGELRLGSEDAGVTLKADAKARLGDRPDLAFDLSAKQLDFDRLSGAPIDAVKRAPPKLPDLATLHRILAAAEPPIQTAIDLTVDNATYGGETLGNLEAHLGLGDRARQPLKISGDGPGGSHIAVDGQLVMDTTPSFAGRVAIDADNLPRAVDWLGTVSPGLPWSGNRLLFKSMRLQGHVAVNSAGIGSDDVAITFDRSILSGSARLAPGDGARPTKITADLAAATLDLDALPSLAAFKVDAGSLDLDLRLNAKAIKVSQVGDGTLDAGHLRIAIAKSGHDVDLKEFRADNLGGAAILATGHLDSGHGTLAVTLDAARLDAAAGLVRQLAPGPTAEALVARAGALAPAKLKLDASLKADGKGAFAPSRVSIVGTLGATRLSAITKSDPTQADQTAITASLDAPDGGPLLSQLGVLAHSSNVIGASHITLTAQGLLGKPLESKLTIALGATKLDAEGSFDILSAAVVGSGRMGLHSPDLTPLFQSFAIAFPDMQGRIPATIDSGVALGESGMTLNDLKGRIGTIATRGTLQYRRAAGDQPALTGAIQLDHLTLSSLVALALGPPRPAVPPAIWSQDPFAAGLVAPPKSSVTLEAKTLELSPGLDAKNASLDFDMTQDVVTLNGIKADLLGGRLDGGLTLRRDGGQATIEGKIALNNVAIHLKSLDTRLTSKLDFAGGGTSAQGLVASLAGSGEAMAADLTIPRGDPSALTRVFNDVETDVLTVDQDAVTRAFEDAATAKLSAGGRHFTLSLAAGLLHFNPKDPNDSRHGPVSSKIDATFDLSRASSDVHIEETLNALPKNWTGTPPTIAITLSGPNDKPSRSVDVSGFLNAVAARALARETARVEAYEFDIRERAFFNARLQSERRREDERQKAEADRKARIEAARQERARQEAAAKAARDAGTDVPTQDRSPTPPDSSGR